MQSLSHVGLQRLPYLLTLLSANILTFPSTLHTVTLSLRSVYSLDPIVCGCECTLSALLDQKEIGHMKKAGWNGFYLVWGWSMGSLWAIF